VGAAMLSVLIFPAIALMLLKRPGVEEAAAAEGAAAAGPEPEPRA
jgi:hypothetical protein